MTTYEEACAACQSLPFAFQDHPFGEEWTVYRHKENDKLFAMIFERNGQLWMNLKAEPQWGDFWRQTYPAVLPAYHMNKRHWISVILDGSMTDEEVFRLISDSFDLTKPKTRRKKADQITEQ